MYSSENEDSNKHVNSDSETIGIMTTTPKIKIDEENLRKISSAPVTPVTITPSSSSPSLLTMDDIANNVNKMEQLKLLPSEFVSYTDPSRPLRHVDGDQILTYALQPMWYSVQFILLVELLERFCFYGINYTQTAYLTGVYDPDWNADLTAVEASSFVAICITIAYTSPFVGATLADTTRLGDYGTILLGCAGFYLPGLAILCYTTIPSMNGDPFNTNALALGVLFLWPMGTGMVKSVVNVFGAKQFHPLIQSALIETYYVNFYMCINIGALLGGILIPIIAQFRITIAYAIPVFVLALGIAIFLLGSTRYVRPKPRGDMFLDDSKYNKTKNMSLNDNNSDLSISAVAKVCLLLVPFNIAYSQMSTTFIIQGTVMKKAFGVFDAASMNNADTISVLWFGFWIGNVLYPWLSKKQIKLQTTHKFALGSFMGVLALAWSLLVDYMIHQKYQQFSLLSSGMTSTTTLSDVITISPQISVLWQIPSYTLIGIGEIFAVSSAYEVAFMVAPPAKKALASAVNLFFIGGLPNIICLFLYQKCSTWFENANGRASIHTVETYTEAHVYLYFSLLFGIALLGVFINIFPPVTNWVQRMEEKASNAIRTPKLSATPQQQREKRREEQQRFSDESFHNSKESAPLLISVSMPIRQKQESKIKQHQDYLEYGTGPLLHKSGSMRAGTFLKKTDPAALKRQQQYTKLKYYQQKKRKNTEQSQQRILLVPSASKPPLQSKEAPY